MKEQSAKILVITVSAWNSKVGANTWAALLEKYDSKNIANICIREEVPDSKVCGRFFVVSENRVIKSVLNRKIETGREVFLQKETNENANDLCEHNARYMKMRKRRRYIFLYAREILWKLGKWKTKELDDFLDDFKPDIILHSMDGYIHLNRITDYAIRRTRAKAIGYIWDDNFTYKQSSAIGYKIYRYFQRKSLKKLAKKTSAFFAITPMTKREADRFFGIDCVVLTKPLNAFPSLSDRTFTFPLRILYTGNLFIGRDKSLLSLIDAAERINAGECYFTIDVFTTTPLSAEQKAKFNRGGCTIHDAIPQSEVIKKQKEYDVLLFLEAMRGKYSRTARLSFSTKLTDYLSAGKPILAIGNADTAPMRYLSENNAALTAANDLQIEKCLEEILQNPQILQDYAVNACRCGIENHDPQKIQETFDRVLNEVYQSEKV